jgi:hypothetical protein
MDQNAKPGAESLACAAAEIQAPKIDRTVVFSLFWLDFEYLSVCAVQVCIHTVYIYTCYRYCTNELYLHNTGAI